MSDDELFYRSLWTQFPGSLYEDQRHPPAQPCTCEKRSGSCRCFCPRCKSTASLMNGLPFLSRERAAIEAVAMSIWGRARLDKGKPWEDFQEDARQAVAAYNAALQETSGERWEVYDERRHGDQSGTVFLVIGPRVPTRPLDESRGAFRDPQGTGHAIHDPEWLSAGEAARRFASGEDAPEGEPWPPEHIPAEERCDTCKGTGWTNTETGEPAHDPSRIDVERCPECEEREGDPPPGSDDPAFPPERVVPQDEREATPLQRLEDLAAEHIIARAVINVYEHELDRPAPLESFQEGYEAAEEDIVALEEERQILVTWKDGSVAPYPPGSEPYIRKMLNGPSAPVKIEVQRRKVSQWEKDKDNE